MIDRNDKLSGVLYLTTIDAKFDRAKDIAIGPHCFIGRDEIFPGWRKLIFAEPFPDERVIEIEEKKLRGLVNYLLPGIADKLNAYHGTSYSIDFWRILILPWLIDLSQKIWTSYARIRILINRFGDRPIRVKVCKGNLDWQFEGTVDFLTTIMNDYQFNWWIESKIISSQSPNNWKLELSNPVTHPKIEKPTEPPISQSSGSIRTKLRNIKYWLGYSDIPGVRWSGLLLAVYVNLLPKRPSKLKYVNDSHFHPKSHFPEPFLLVLDEFIKLTMPESFLVGFKVLQEKASRFHYVPGRLRLGALSFWNEQEKVISAFAKEAGEKRVVVQHGGEYGMLNYNMMYNLMEGRQCIFVSWGWAYDEPAELNSYVVPLPSPLHSKLADQHKRETDQIIYVSGGIRLHVSRLHWAFKINSPVNYCNETVRFIEELEETVRESVIFRPYRRTANDIEIGDSVRQKFPDMPMLETNLDDAILKCKLVILYSHSTTMNFSLAANVPTIIHVAPDRMIPRPEAEPFFSPLRKCGVIHDSPEEAAWHLNQIHNDIEGWWHRPDVQEARKIWVHQFARTDRFLVVDVDEGPNQAKKRWLTL